VGQFKITNHNKLQQNRPDFYQKKRLPQTRYIQKISLDSIIVDMNLKPLDLI